jgi:hypothetical protein
MTLEQELLDSYLEHPIGIPTNASEFLEPPLESFTNPLKIKNGLGSVSFYSPTMGNEISPARVEKYLKTAGSAIGQSHLSRACLGKGNLFDNFDWTNVYLAGGSIANASVCQLHKTTNHDFDLYIVGLSEDQAKEKLRYMLEHFASVAQTVGDNQLPYPRIIRTATAVTITWGIGFRNVQICLTLARDILSLLLSFDLAPCKVAYQPGRIFMTPTARLAYKHGLYPVWDSLLNGPNIGKRIVKYEGRGFTPVFIEAEVTKLKYVQVLAELVKPQIIDDQYNVVDLETDELNVHDERHSRIRYDAERIYRGRYVQDPNFIMVQYRSKCKPTFPHQGVGCSMKTPDGVFYAIDNVDWYLQEQMITSPKMYPEYVACNLSDHIKFLSLPDLMDLLKTRTAPDSVTIKGVFVNGPDKLAITFEDAQGQSFVTEYTNGKQTTTPSQTEPAEYQPVPEEEWVQTIYDFVHLH